MSLTLSLSFSTTSISLFAVALHLSRLINAVLLVHRVISCGITRLYTALRTPRKVEARKRVYIYLFKGTKVFISLGSAKIIYARVTICGYTRQLQPRRVYVCIKRMREAGLPNVGLRFSQHCVIYRGG